MQKEINSKKVTKKWPYCRLVGFQVTSFFLPYMFP